MTELGEVAPGLFGDLFSNAAVARELSDRAWLQALLDAEAALAMAEADLGVIPGEAAAQIGAACRSDRFDIAALGRRAGDSGNPVVPLVADLRAAVGEAVRDCVHYGATSQDIIDTGMSLVAQRALTHILGDLGVVADWCARLAAEHRRTVMPARTLMQQAAPITFGVKAAAWLVAVEEARAMLDRLRRVRLAAQLGGAAGNLGVLGRAGPAVARAFAGHLNLASPPLPWHTNRARIGELAGALGVACGVLGKLAGDVILLGQTEVAETHPRGGGGGSSSMPQKANPVSAILVVAASRRAPGLVATLLTTMVQEHERAAGAWHAEWPTMSELLAATGGAASHGRRMLEGLSIAVDQMRSHVDANDSLMAGAVVGALASSLGRAEAHELVTRCVRLARARRTSLRDVLVAEPRVTAVLSGATLDAALDPLQHLAADDQLIDTALRIHENASVADSPA